jgi:hypothetical protein
MRNIKNGAPKKEGKINGTNEPTMCSFVKIINNGTMVTCPGIIITANVIINKVFLPLQLIRAKLYATSGHEIITPNVANIEIMRVFFKYEKNDIVVTASK